MSVVSDRVYGTIELHDCSWKIINTPEYQRLSNIKQLGAASFVFPSASTTRLEHCIGVAHLARKLGAQFQTTQPELGITGQDLLCLELAGLCHDLGHGPYSHAYEAFCESQGEHFHHESMSCQILMLIIHKYRLSPVLLAAGISEEEVHMICEMIFGSEEEAPEGWEWKGPPTGKEFLYEIVSNKRTGLDVDRFDYFERDADRTGVKICFDLERLIVLSNVCEVEGENIICYSVKARQCVADVFETRFRLHKCIYSHKTIKAVELWIFYILRKARPWFQANLGIPLETAWKDSELFATLDDTIFSSIIHSGHVNEELKSAIHRLNRRQIWKIRKQKYFDRKGDALQYRKELEDEFGHDGRYVVNMTPIHYGDKSNDPMDNVIFYSEKDRFSNKFIRNCPPYQLWIVRLFGLPSTPV